MKDIGDMASCYMIYLPRFVEIGTGVKTILRFFHSNLKGCNSGITDDRDL
jgi:hypothetical protein